MAVSRDILRSWRHPRLVMRDLLAVGRREDRALAFLMVGCFLVFVAQWPRLMRVSSLGNGAEATDLTMLLSTSFFLWVTIMPLALYGVAALTHLAARLLGGRGSWYGARLALFWSILATAPLLMFHGLVFGFMGEGAATDLVGLLVLAGCLAVWASGLYEAEAGRDAGHG